MRARSGLAIALGGVLISTAAIAMADTHKPTTGDARHHIVVDSEVDSEQVEVFEEMHGRLPNEAEQFDLHRVWLNNEVLYREGLTLLEQQGKPLPQAPVDPETRERVIHLAAAQVDAGLQLPVPSEASLRQWFETHRERYDEPARYDFEEALVAPPASERAVRNFVQQLNGGAAADAQSGLRVFRGRPQASLAQSYGEAFAATLAQLPQGRWQAVETRSGWRAIKLDAVTAARPATLETARAQVLEDWRYEAMAEARNEALLKLTRNYDVHFEFRAHPAHED